MFWKKKKKELHNEEVVNLRNEQSKKEDQLLDALEIMAQELSSITEEVFSQSSQVSEKTEIISTNSLNQAEKIMHCYLLTQDLVQSFERLMEHQENMASSVAKTRESTNVNLSRITLLQQKSDDTVKVTEEVVEDVSELLELMKEITAFTNTIQTIASQTNLLSLNASIEAARAGDAGKGFSVVANEVKKLSDASSLAAKDIESTIQSVSKQMGQITNKIKRTNEYAKIQHEEVHETKEAIEHSNNNTRHIEEAILESDSILHRLMNQTKEINENTYIAAEYSEKNAEEITIVNEASTELKEAMNRVAEQTEELMALTKKIEKSE